MLELKLSLSLCRFFSDDREYQNVDPQDSLGESSSLSSLSLPVQASLCFKSPVTNDRLMLIKACYFNLKPCSFVAEATWLALASYPKGTTTARFLCCVSVSSLQSEIFTTVCCALLPASLNFLVFDETRCSVNNLRD